MDAVMRMPAIIANGGNLGVLKASIELASLANLAHEQSQQTGTQQPESSLPSNGS